MTPDYAEWMTMWVRMLVLELPTIISRVLKILYKWVSLEVANIGNEQNARKFLDDFLIEMESAGGLEWTIDGLVMLLDAVANKDKEDLQSFIEHL